MSQTTIVETNLEASRKDREKQTLQLKLKELEGKRTSLNESINNIESKIVSYRSIYDSQFKLAQQDLSKQGGKDAKSGSPLKSAMAQRGAPVGSGGTNTPGNNNSVADRGSSKNLKR